MTVEQFGCKHISWFGCPRDVQSTSTGFWACPFQGGGPSIKEGCCSPRSPVGGQCLCPGPGKAPRGWPWSVTGQCPTVRCCSNQTLWHTLDCSALCLSLGSLKFTYNAFCVGKVFTSHIYPVKLAAKHWRADKHCAVNTIKYNPTAACMQINNNNSALCPLFGV